MAPRPPKGEVSFAESIDAAVAGAGLIVESVPEDLSIKRSVYAAIEIAASPDAIISSSTSGILPTDLQKELAHPERLLVAHPFNPVYLLPLVELIGGEQTGADVIAWAKSFYADLGMHPLHIRKEIEAFVADRLLEATWRESLWLVKDGIVSTEELDGMRHFIEQFGPCLQWPWTKLTDVPELDDELIEKISSQSDAQSGHHSIRELERIRDDNLIAILQALKANDWGAGKTLAAYEKKCFDRGAIQSEDIDITKEIRTLERQVPADWTDYNNHMNEARYLQCFADASDGMLRMLGVNADYVASTGSYFTVETHIRHLDEVAALQPIYATTQVLSAKGKKLHLFHRLYHGDGRLLATGEHMLIHVSLDTRKAADPADEISRRASEIAAAHARLEIPEGAGRAVGRR
jgi:carnitine 3-dehydrogenase